MPKIQSLQVAVPTGIAVQSAATGSTIPIMAVMVAMVLIMVRAGVMAAQQGQLLTTAVLAAAGVVAGMMTQTPVQAMASLAMKAVVEVWANEVQQIAQHQIPGMAQGVAGVEHAVAKTVVPFVIKVVPAAVRHRVQQVQQVHMPAKMGQLLEI